MQVPFLFKLAIDWLAALGGADASLASFTETNATLLALFASPAAVLIGYGIARSGVSACTGKHFVKHSRILFFVLHPGTDMATFFVLPNMIFLCCQNCEMLYFLK